MRRAPVSRLVLWLVPLLVAACSLGQSAPAPTATAPPATAVAPAEATVAVTPTTPSTTLPPSPTFPPTPAATPMPIFGVELSAFETIYGLDLAQAAGAYWARRAAVWWPDVEPTPGARNWQALAALEQEFAAAAGAGLQAVVVIRGTPDWAQAVPGYPCGPMRPEHLGAFAAFVGELVGRYSAPPYNVLYWEIWNEPDIDATLTTPDSLWGCWGNVNDEFYGGGYYADMLAQVYPQVKAANPAAQVLVGGLLLDCDPRIAEGCARGAHGDKPPKFIEGVLQAGGGDYFDGISFHAYDYQGSALGRYGHPNWNSNATTTGPVVLAKTDYLRSLLSTYNVTGKYLMNTESAIICGSTGDEPQCQTEEARTTRAYYVAQAYGAALAAGLHANVWYNMTGWRGSGLIDFELNPLPTYEAYRFVAAELRGAAYSHEIVDYAGLKGYEYDRDGQRIWLLWALDAQPHAVSLPAAPTAVYDVFGQPLAATTDLEVGAMPVFIEWSPG